MVSLVDKHQLTLSLLILMVVCRILGDSDIWTAGDVQERLGQN